VAFGYTGELGNNSYRAELEGMYSSVKVDNIGLTSSQITVSYLKDIGEDADKKTYLYSVAVSHDQIENISVMANVYHHWKYDRFFFSPYIGIGIGATRITMFEKSSIRPAGQLKAGFDYRINEDVNMPIGYRYFGVWNDSVKLQAEEFGQASIEGNVPKLNREQKSKVLEEGKKNNRSYEYRQSTISHTRHRGWSYFPLCQQSLIYCPFKKMHG
jgi:opacity protein-like surface antigen